MSGIEETGNTLESGSGAFNDSTPENFTLSCAARNHQGPALLPYSTLLLTIVNLCFGYFYFLLGHFLMAV